MKSHRDVVWQGLVRDAAEQEMAITGETVSAGPFEVRIHVVFKDRKQLETSTLDPDNVEKNILDALKGVVWTDDKMKVIRRLTIEALLHPGIRPEACVPKTVIEISRVFG